MILPITHLTLFYNINLVVGASFGVSYLIFPIYTAQFVSQHTVVGVVGLLVERARQQHMRYLTLLLSLQGELFQLRKGVHVVLNGTYNM